MNIELRTYTVRGVSFYDSKYGKYGGYRRFLPGDKITILYNGRTISGVVVEVGTKFISLLCSGAVHKKSSVTWRTHKIDMQYIERIAIFPKGFQKYQDVYCNKKGECS